MNSRLSKVLVIGYGNPGRRDDGLGPALAAALEELNLPGVTVDSDYQLSVEDAANVAEHDVVVFADADTNGPAPFSFQRIEPRASISFSTHSVTPEAVLGLAAELFNSPTPGYVLGIRGYEFNEFGERLSEQARANLAAALEFIKPVICNRTFERHASPLAVASAIGDMQCKTENT